jgi:hypothetical protein
MLGNWSLGDYFKAESLAWSYEFLTRELSIDPACLAVTVFAGDADAPRDDISAGAWRSLGIPGERIFYLPKADNWWGPAGVSGPCGPDSEIFYDTGLPDHPGCRPGCPCGKWFEIWNNVFMEYNKTAQGSYEKLPQRNVDTGMGVERALVALNGLDDIFRVETIYPMVQRIEHTGGRRKRPFHHRRPPAGGGVVLRMAPCPNVEAGTWCGAWSCAVRHGRKLACGITFAPRCRDRIPRRRVSMLSAPQAVQSLAGRGASGDLGAACERRWRRPPGPGPDPATGAFNCSRPTACRWLTTEWRASRDGG